MTLTDIHLQTGRRWGVVGTSDEGSEGNRGDEWSQTRRVTTESGRQETSRNRFVGVPIDPNDQHIRRRGCSDTPRIPDPEDTEVGGRG